MRKTKIIATVGPASKDREILEKLLSSGVDVVRINCSHADHPTIAQIVSDVREISAKLDRSIGTLLDLAGPKIRTAKLADGQVELEPAQKFTLTSREVEGTKE